MGADFRKRIDPCTKGTSYRPSKTMLSEGNSRLPRSPYFVQHVPRLRPGTLPPPLKVLVMRRSKLPRLLLRRSSLQVDAAVLLFEYTLLGIGIRCFIPFDDDGYRSVIAPEQHRAEVALQAGEVLIKRGALLALISLMTEQPRWPGRTLCYRRWCSARSQGRRGVSSASLLPMRKPWAA